MRDALIKAMNDLVNIFRGGPPRCIPPLQMMPFYFGSRGSERQIETSLKFVQTSGRMPRLRKVHVNDRSMTSVDPVWLFISVNLDEPVTPCGRGSASR